MLSAFYHLGAKGSKALNPESNKYHSAELVMFPYAVGEIGRLVVELDGC